MTDGLVYITDCLNNKFKTQDIVNTLNSINCENNGNSVALSAYLDYITENHFKKRYWDIKIKPRSINQQLIDEFKYNCLPEFTFIFELNPEKSNLLLYKLED